jgi:hypothetical protein
MNPKASRAPLWISAAVVLADLTSCSHDAIESKAARRADDVARDEPSAAAGAGAEDTDADHTDAENSDEAPPASADPCGAGEFDSTFTAIQQVIFEERNCTNDMCHGDAKIGGLDLRADAAYEHLIEVRSENSPLFRVMPGEPDESFLYNKLRAATEPGSVAVEGSPMPSGMAPLSAEHLEAVRRWVEAGAPREGSIGDSITGRSASIAELLGSCLPEETAIAIKPLEPPAADEGIQFVMAPFPLRAQFETDVCFAQYYDVSDVVPAEFQDPERGVFFINGRRTRQDPHSHHLVVTHSTLGAEFVEDPSFGEWACRGGDGDDAGEPCDPLQAGACGADLCASEPQAKAACIGFGPSGGAGLFRGPGISTAQTAQYYQAPREGVYESIPIRGILYWNSHAFNLTSEDTQLHAWVNLYYATDPQHEIETIPVVNNISIAAGQPPFTTERYCATWVAPQDSDLYTLSSHTHKRGRNFTVDLADGTRIYTSAIYSDPIEKAFDPPMRFDSVDPAERTLTYCAEFNNGVTEDGTLDIDLVTRLSTMPERTTCMPVACVAGKIGAPCQGASDHAACDSSAGAGDGSCDACAITAGQTTENEMFVLSPSIVRL